MTIWGLAGTWLGFLAYGVAWFWGGRPERFVAAVLILYCMAAIVTFRWFIGGFHWPRMIVDNIHILVVIWFGFRSNRWWLFVVAAADVLTAGMNVATLLYPAFYIASASAQVGLGYLADLALLLSPCERVLAGEAPARHAAWARADIATGAARRRKTAGLSLSSKARTDRP